MLGIGLVTSSCSTSPDAGPKADERQVYCLDPAQRDNLVRAAIELDLASDVGGTGGLVVDGKKLSVDTWQQRKAPDFNRACDALMAANRPRVMDGVGADAGSWATKLLPSVSAVLLLLTGALVTMLTGGLREAGTRRRLQAARLRTTTENFVSACEGFIDDLVSSRGSPPSEQPLRDRRLELVAKLREMSALYPRLADTQQLLDLVKNKLSGRIWRDWELAKDKQEKQEKVRRVRDELANLSDGIESINRKLERSFIGRIGGSER